MNDLEALREALRDAMKQPPVVLTPLPRRVRLRLWVQHRIDGAGIWLVKRGHYRVAIGLWKLTGGWD